MADNPIAGEAITLAVLAGGAGSRMGRPKGLLQFGGRPILEFILDRIRWPGPTALVTAPGLEHPPGWEKFDGEWIDPAADLGPLRGVLTALQNAKTARLAVITVDMPGISRQQIEWLARELEPPGRMGVMCRRSMGTESVIEPFPLLLRREAEPLVEERLEARRLSVFGLLEESGFALADAPPEWNEGVWMNLNHPEDLERARRAR